MTTRVYAAERRVFGARMGSREHGVSILDAQVLVDRLVPGWTVVRGKGARSWCHKRKPVISLGKFAGLPTVLHEVAHALTGADGHGVAFQTAYLRLIESEMSPWWARRLRAALRHEATRGYRQVMRATEPEQ